MPPILKTILGRHNDWLKRFCHLHFSLLKRSSEAKLLVPTFSEQQHVETLVDKRVPNTFIGNIQNDDFD